MQASLQKPAKKITISKMLTNNQKSHPRMQLRIITDKNKKDLITLTHIYQSKNQFLKSISPKSRRSELGTKKSISTIPKKDNYVSSRQQINRWSSEIFNSISKRPYTQQKTTKNMSSKLIRPSIRKNLKIDIQESTVEYDAQQQYQQAYQKMSKILNQYRQRLEQSQQSNKLLQNENAYLKSKLKKLLS